MHVFVGKREYGKATAAGPPSGPTAAAKSQARNETNAIVAPAHATIQVPLQAQMQLMVRDHDRHSVDLESMPAPDPSQEVGSVRQRLGARLLMAREICPLAWRLSMADLEESTGRARLGRVSYPSRAAHSMPRCRMVRISGTSNSWALWPSEE
jgi:hypothetical protein